MNDQDTGGDKDHGWIADAIQGGLPQLLAGPAGKAISQLIGTSADIPAAWLEGIAQGVRDKTASRSQVSAAIAKKAAEIAISDPAVMDRALNVVLAKAYRSQTNREAIAKVAVEQLKELPPTNESTEGPSDDWMNGFIRLAEDASSARLQDMFGRILAGEVKKTGSFSLTAVRVVAELDQRVAEDFSMVWGKSVGLEVDYSSKFQVGEWFSRWKRLAEAGLMASDAVTRYRPTAIVDQEYGYWSPMSAMGTTYLLILLEKNSTASWKNIPFTRAGAEIGQILAPPDYEANMREAARNISNKGVQLIELHKSNKTKEVLFRTTSG